MAGEKASLAKYKAIQKKLENAQKKVTKIREVADEKVQHIVRATEVSAAAFAFGLAHGYGEAAPTSERDEEGNSKRMSSNIAGIPTPLLGAAVLHGLGLFGIGGDMSGHLHSFGDGALAAFASNFGRQIGAIKGAPGGENVKYMDAISKAMKPGDQINGSTTNLLGTGIAGQRLTDAELAALNKIG